jgi:urease gamma subunit
MHLTPREKDKLLVAMAAIVGNGSIAASSSTHRLHRR